jgi:hypothetical protein
MKKSILTLLATLLLTGQIDATYVWGRCPKVK